MKYELTEPCNECPFRQNAAPGWLGPWTPEELVKQVQENDVAFACHQTIEGFETEMLDELQQCAGAAIFANHICKLARDPERKAHQNKLGDDRDRVFVSPGQLKDHHRKHGKTSGDLANEKAE